MLGQNKTESLVISKRLIQDKFPQDDQTDTNVIAPLKNHFQTYVPKTTLDCLKCVFKEKTVVGFPCFNTVYKFSQG